MDNMHLNRLTATRVVALVAVAVLSVAVSPPPMATAAGPSDVAPEVREADGVQLAKTAEAHGALGVYFDESMSQFVVVVPAAAPTTFSLADASRLSVSVRVETRDIDRPTIDQIERALVAVRPAIMSYSYGFVFDPQSGTVTLTSEAPETSFAAIEAAFPGKISFRPGWFRQAGWDNPTQPYPGGAFLNGQKLCTSGFAIDFNSGGRAMVTAGHCNDNGIATNMGTVRREAAAYPYWDFELVTGRTYRGAIYDSSVTTRSVINASNPSVGSTYCTTGRTTGFRCGWTVRKLNQTICYVDIPICAHNLAEFYNAAGDHVQPGDSGGPLWYSSSSPFGAGIRGVISGWSWDLFQGYSSYATQYQTIANYYVGHATFGG